MQILDDTGGYVLYRDGLRLIFVERGTRWTVVARFVLGLITGIVGINGVVQLLLGLSGGGSWLMGVTLLATSILTGLALARVHRHAKALESRPLHELRPILVLDTDSQQLLGPLGEPWAPLREVSFRKTFQAGSSARALECQWPGGRMVVGRGGGMGVASVDGAVHALETHGFRVLK